MKWLDGNDDILEWASESIKIPYKNPIKEMKGDMRPINAHYYPDFYIKYKNSNGEIEQAVIEVKMSSETRPPKTPKRITRIHKAKMNTYMVNEAKWKAAKLLCDKMNVKFIVITEKFINTLTY